LSPSHFVFIDDNPAEIAQMSAFLPQVRSLLFPSDVTSWPLSIFSSPLFDRLPPTTEDLQRAKQYQEEKERKNMAENSSPEEYLASLDIQVKLFSPEPLDIPRFSQMISKTNQFNLNCHRLVDTDLINICKNPNYVARLISARDRFGDYGTIGAYIFHKDGDTAVIDIFLMSCRAMGRTVEEAMLNNLFQEAKNLSLTKIIATVIKCPRNEPVQTFFQCFGCEEVNSPFIVKPTSWPKHIKLM
ncbi:MAG: hypothetical protein WAQ98_17800, partial [Blastocatellia bacterium]